MYVNGVTYNDELHNALQKDGRQPEHSGFKWSVAADVESVAWDPHTEYSFVVCDLAFSNF